jgi:hypothetical protein
LPIDLAQICRSRRRAHPTLIAHLFSRGSPDRRKFFAARPLNASITEAVGEITMSSIYRSTKKLAAALLEDLGKPHGQGGRECAIRWFAVAFFSSARRTPKP